MVSRAVGQVTSFPSRLKKRRRGDLRISEYHYVEALVLHRPDGLRQPKSPAIPDVQHTDGKIGWVRVPEAALCAGSQRHELVVGKS